MKVVLFGGTGMVGQGVLRECLRDPEVEEVLSVVRTACGQKHPKLKETVVKDLFEFPNVAGGLSGYDACIYCLGVTSAGMSEQHYTRITYDLTLCIAQFLLKQNPGMTLIYVSGQGTDSTERGRSMWARVKGKTENALLALPFRAAYMFRPGFIQPLHGIKSKTRVYRLLYAGATPLYPVLKFLFPDSVTTTERLGCAMLKAAKHGAPRHILENRDINALLSRVIA
jgi:uncharacterized protein YbjT (DUF2867 family)